MSLDIDELRKQLSRIGLNREEQICYLALRDLGSGTANDVVRKSANLGLNISPAKAFAALKKLDDKHIVQVSISVRPKIYHFPADPSAQLKLWAEKKVSEYRKELDSSLSQLMHFLEKEKNRPPSVIGLIDVIGIGRRQEILEATWLRTRRMFQRAQKKIDVMSARFHWIGMVEPELRGAFDEKGVVLRVLLSKDNLKEKTDYNEILKELKSVYPDQFHLFDYNPRALRLSVIDDCEAIMVIRSPIDEGIGAFHIDNVDFVKELLLPAIQSHLKEARPITISDMVGI